MIQKMIRRMVALSYAEGGFAYRWRSRRMRDFARLMNPPEKARIIDLGGTEYNWSLLQHDFDLTIVNLPGRCGREGSPGKVRFIEADATDLSRVFSDREFDIAFSNSVIEHVGDESRQRCFASEVRRIAKSYWVQTPSPQFPIEAHCGFPFYWRYPAPVQAWLLKRWRAQLPEWTRMMEGTRCLSKQAMASLFPDSRLYVEKVFLLEKSYAAFLPFKPKGAIAL